MTCPKCKGMMRIISVIEELDIIEKILRHLGLWDIRNHDSPKPAISNFIPDWIYDFSDERKLHYVPQIPAVGWN